MPNRGNLVISILSWRERKIDVSFENVIGLESIGDYTAIAPLRLLSFDIECQGRQGHFPEAKHDAIIQIGNVVSIQGESDKLYRVVFVLGTCKSIPGAKVVECETEEDLLIGWRHFLLVTLKIAFCSKWSFRKDTDPDIITGYNIQNFDIPYILDRAEVAHLFVPMHH